MSDLSKEIEELNSLGREYESKRQVLNDKIRELFNPEFERIKSKMPEGNETVSFYVYDGQVNIFNPHYKGEVVNEQQLDWLNEQFDEEFSRIRKKYGFSVRFTEEFYIE